MANELEERARSVARRIVGEFRQGGWLAKEDEIARLILRTFAQEGGWDADPQPGAEVVVPLAPALRGSE